MPCVPGEASPSTNESRSSCSPAWQAVSPVNLGTVHLANARTFIEDHLTDSGLTAARVAAGIGISERHLSRAFAATGTTVPQFVLARRLERARALLASSPQIAGR